MSDDPTPREQAIRQLLEDEIANQDGGPNAQYCWWCNADINGMNGPKSPHEPDCWRVRADALLDQLRAEGQWLAALDFLIEDYNGVTGQRVTRESVMAEVIKRQGVR